ncbi:MAG: AraC family transcriptional regulator [Bacteroidota bacterium]
MKQAIRKSPISETKCYRINDLIAPYFDPHWHFHQEYQLAFVLQGTGTRFVGDDISHFEPGDMVLTGANLPHVWRNDEEYFQNKGLLTHVIVIYFSIDFLQGAFLNKEEMKGIRELLERSHRGLLIQGETRDHVGSIVQKMTAQKGFEGVISLLRILNILSTKKLKFINKEGYLNTVTDSDSDRMSRIHSYILDHYRGELKLGQLAQLANLTPTAFSRYFKAHTNKTFTDFIAELRISNACKLLQRNDLSILRIAHECGYRTLSNFNKKFRELMDDSPLQYRKKYRNIG